MIKGLEDNLIPRGCVRIDGRSIGIAFREKIKNDLIIYPRATSTFNSSPEPIRLFYEEGDFIGVPRGYYNVFLKPRGVEGSLVVSIGGNDLRPADPIKLREGQDIAVDGILQVYKENTFSGGIIEAKVGSGKTVISLEIARRLGLKVLVSVHNSVLFDQWQEEIPKFFPHWRIGKLQAEKMDVKDKDIVIGTLQSLSMKDYPPWIYEEFGMIIVDELHLVASYEFQKLLLKFAPKYILGVTGTLKRADGAENVFKFGTGKIVSVMNVAKNLDPTVYFVSTQYAWDKFKNLHRSMRSIKFLEELIESPSRNEIIVRNAVKAAQAGRNVLVLTKRVQHAENLCFEIQQRIPDIAVAVLVGSKNKAQRDAGKSAQIICATVQLIGTGFNEPRLDTVIFATPVAGASLEQCIGRIQRFYEDKKPPMVLDIVDIQSEYAFEMAESRYRRYKSKNWKLFGDQMFKKEGEVKKCILRKAAK